MEYPDVPERGSSDDEQAIDHVKRSRSRRLSRASGRGDPLEAGPSRHGHGRGKEEEGDRDDDGAADGDGDDLVIPDRPASPDLPLTMTASAVLATLPPDASAALASVSTRPDAGAGSKAASRAPPTSSTATAPAAAAAAASARLPAAGVEGGDSKSSLVATAKQQAPETPPEPAADEKVLVRFKAVGGSAPRLSRSEVRKISAAQRFEAVAAHLRRALRLGAREALFLYVNSAFAPALDEVVGNLHRCFKDSSDQLIVAYSITPAFG